MGVMNVKRSTQVFSNTDQNQPSRSEGSSNLSAADQAKFFGEQSVGDVLNKVADPNWVDPTKKVRVAGDNQLDKDAFLKLMLAQMKHQDPTNPMQSHEMAAQLAQFTSLEQMNNMNSTLEAIKNQQAPNGNYQALGLIGKKVSGDSSKLSRVAGDTKHGFNFDLLGDAAKVKVTIKDGAGNTVRSMEVNNLKKGANSIDWNGLDDNGLPARAGDYKVSVEGFSSTGGKVYARTSFEGRITGMNFTPNGPVLLVGKQSIRLSDVKKIEEAGPEDLMPAMPLEVKNLPKNPGTVGSSAGQSANSSATADQKSNVAEEIIPPAEEPDEMMEGNIADVPMARDLQQKVAKGY